MKKGQSHINHGGFSLVELLVAVSVFLIFFFAVTDVTVNSSKQARHSVNRERAVQLAEEAIEALRNIRDADFTNLNDGTYGLATSSNQFSYSGSSDITGIFTRSIVVSSINDYQKKLDVTVSWADQISDSNSVLLTSYLTDWRRITPLAGITLTKTVINHGGVKATADFSPYTVGTTTVTLGVAASTTPGTYTVGETTDSDYILTFGGDCDSFGSITLISGDAKVCNLTNEQRYVPVVSSPTSTAITQTSVTLGAEVTSLGLPASISERGICYDTSPSPLANCTAEGGTTLGTYTQLFTGLSCGALYYYRGYAINEKGTGYSVDDSFTTISCDSVPTVTTPTVNNITGTTAILGANVTSLGIPDSISERGTCWGTSPNPVTNCIAEGGTTLGTFTHLRAGLNANTTYYFRGYATNVTGTGYSEDGIFATTNDLSLAVGTPTTYDSGNSNSAVISKPTDVTQNDIMFAYIGHQNVSDRLNSIPSGWNLLAKNDNGTNHMALYYKVAGASEPTSYTFGFSASVRVGVSISAWRGGFNPANPIDQVSNIQYTTNNTTVRAASMNLTFANENVFVFPGIITSGNRTFTAPVTQGGGWLTGYNFGNSSSQFSRSQFYKIIPSAGVTGVIDSICSTSGTTNKHAFAVSLRP